MLSLPLSNSPLCELFDVADLVAERFTTLRNAIHIARKTDWRGIRAINFLVIRADGRVQLMSIGSRGGRKVLWNFGKVA